MMKANRLVLAALLGSAGAASIAAVAEDKSAMHKMMPAKEPAKARVEGELSSQAPPDGLTPSR